MGNPTYARITVVITRLRCRLQRHSTPFEQAPDRPSRVEAGRHAAVGRVCNPWPISHTFRRLAPALAFAFGRTGSLSDASSETSTSESFSDSDESDEARFLLFLRAIAGELFTKNEQVEKRDWPMDLAAGPESFGSDRPDRDSIHADKFSAGTHGYRGWPMADHQPSRVADQPSVVPSSIGHRNSASRNFRKSHALLAWHRSTEVLCGPRGAEGGARNELTGNVQQSAITRPANPSIALPSWYRQHRPEPQVLYSAKSLRPWHVPC